MTIVANKVAETKTYRAYEIVEEILFNFIPFDFEDLLVQYKAKHYAKYGEEFQY